MTQEQLKVAGHRRLNFRLLILTILFIVITCSILLFYYASYTINTAIKPDDRITLKDLIRPTLYESLVGIDIGDSVLANREILVLEAPDIDVIRSKLNAEQQKADVDSPPVGTLLVCDFDKDGVTDREWSCPVGGWVSEPTDPTIKFLESYDPINRFGSKGYALKLWYDIESPNPGFGGIWIQFKNGPDRQTLDLSHYRILSMMIKFSASNMSGMSRVKLEMKNQEEVGTTQVEGITAKWTRFDIPLKNFKGITDWTRMKEMTVVITPELADVKEGLLFFDEIMFK